MFCEEIYNCVCLFFFVLFIDEEYFNIGKGGVCMYNLYLEIV